MDKIFQLLKVMFSAFSSTQFTHIHQNLNGLLNFKTDHTNVNWLIIVWKTQHSFFPLLLLLFSFYTLLLLSFLILLLLLSINLLLILSLSLLKLLSLSLVLFFLIEFLFHHIPLSILLLLIISIIILLLVFLTLLWSIWNLKIFRFFLITHSSQIISIHWLRNYLK